MLRLEYYRQFRNRRFIITGSAALALLIIHGVSAYASIFFAFTYIDGFSYAARFNNLFMRWLLPILAVIEGADVVSRDFRNGMIRTFLVERIGRFRLLGAKAAVLATKIVLLTVLFLAIESCFAHVLGVGRIRIEDGTLGAAEAWRRVVASAAMGFTYSLFCGAMSLCISTIVSGRYFESMVICLILFLVVQFVGLTPGSIIYPLFRPAEELFTSFRIGAGDLISDVIMLVSALLATTMTFVVFKRKDVITTWQV